MPLDVAFLWHMHQPSYRDPQSGELTLPWVRLHATRAYFDMAWLLERHPHIRATFNFVPVLVEQLQSYGDGGRDQSWTLAWRAPAELSAAERAFVVRHFFSVDHERCVQPRPRYRDLLARRERGEPFGDNELRDLQVLFNLAWAGYGMRAEYPLVERLEQQGRGFSEDDKRALLTRQIEVIAEVLPRYRALAERRQIELTTTPYYHPILPLLIDSEHAARCQPDRPRPGRFAWPEDAEAQVRRAIVAHTRAFGAPPRGLWPAEGSVSPEAAALLGRCGLEWIASDEAQLWGSLGKARRADLYRGWRLGAGAPVAVFRDHGLSDLIGFTYSRNTADVAAADLMTHLEHVANSVEDDGAVVLIALDGENPWEYYPDSGRPFLEALYARLADHPRLRTTTVAGHLDAHPAERELPTLHTGSWIDGNFAIWIGGVMENQAWGLLAEARRRFELRRGEVDPKDAERAYVHLLQAEGSDWFWWYGDPFQSDNDEQFDALFRGHLQQVYVALGEAPPPHLASSLYPAVAVHVGQRPRQLIKPDLGRPATYFDWLGAGTVELGAGAGSMHQVSGVFARLRYGYDLDRLFVRLEAPHALADDLTIELITPPPARSWRTSEPSGEGWQRETRAVAFAIPFAELGVSAEQTFELTLQLRRGEVVVERYPTRGALRITVPGPEFEAASWDV